VNSADGTARLTAAALSPCFARALSCALRCFTHPPSVPRLERRPAPPSSDESHVRAAGFDGNWEWAANYSEVPGDYGMKMSSAGSQDNYFPTRVLTHQRWGVDVCFAVHMRGCQHLCARCLRMQGCAVPWCP
jgi:hypothetical protein